MHPLRWFGLFLLSKNVVSCVSTELSKRNCVQEINNLHVAPFQGVTSEISRKNARNASENSPKVFLIGPKFIA